MTTSAPPLPHRVDDRDWSKLTLGEKLKQIEVEGYLVLPDLLSPQQVGRFRELSDPMETNSADYSDKQRSRRDICFDHSELAMLIAHPPTLDFLRTLLGDDIIFLSATYALSLPGHPGISLHTDGQPYGSEIFGYTGSCPIQVRVLYYMDDLTTDVSPFLVVPRSHLSMHAQGNPYLRYASHPEQVIVPAKAGSAVLLNHRCFHGNFPNNGNRPRRMLAYLYRPAWAGPVEAKIPAWPADKVKQTPEAVRHWFVDRNVRRGFDFHHKNKPDNMASEAPGISPTRWSRGAEDGTGWHRMKIEQALAVPTWGGYFSEDLAAVKAGAARDGFCFVGQAVTAGFQEIRHPTEAISIVLQLSDGQVVFGDCLTVQYAGAGGRVQRFNHAQQLRPARQVCDYLRGRTISDFRGMCDELESQQFDMALNRTAVFYGVSQALLLAVAARRQLTAAEVLAHELGTDLPEDGIPIYVQCGEDRYNGVDKAILRRAPVLPHGLINHVELIGADGEVLLNYVDWIARRIERFGEEAYRPEIHIDTYGLIGKMFDHRADRIASYLNELGLRANPFELCVETPVLMASRAAQIEMFAAIRTQLRKLDSDVQIIADEWANDVNDIEAFIAAEATDMVNVKSPDLGSIIHAAEAVLACKAGGVRPILGGSCNDSDQSGRVMCHVALASQPAWILARPGMGIDEGFQIVHNEMARTLALVATRKAVPV